MQKKVHSCQQIKNRRWQNSNSLSKIRKKFKSKTLPVMRKSTLQRLWWLIFTIKTLQKGALIDPNNKKKYNCKVLVTSKRSGYLRCISSLNIKWLMQTRLLNPAKQFEIPLQVTPCQNKVSITRSSHFSQTRCKLTKTSYSSLIKPYIRETKSLLLKIWN